MRKLKSKYKYADRDEHFFMLTAERQFIKRAEECFGLFAKVVIENRKNMEYIAGGIQQWTKEDIEQIKKNN